EPACGHVRGQDPQGREARRSSRRAADEVRVRHQSQDRQDARPDAAAIAAGASGPRDRVSHRWLPSITLQRTGSRALLALTAERGVGRTGPTEDRASARGVDMMRRRAFLTASLSAIGLSHTVAARAAEQRPASQSLEALVWPLVSGEQPGIRTFAGHTNTVLDIVGRIGAAPRLVIYTEGNHLMVLLSKEIVGAFPAWATTHPQHAHLNLDNVVVVTMPQPIVVQMIRTGAIALGNLTLGVSRASGLFPDVVMGGPAPQRELRTLGVVEPQARYFSRNRGRALLVRKGRPLGVHRLADEAAPAA